MGTVKNKLWLLVIIIGLIFYMIGCEGKTTSTEELAEKEILEEQVQDYLSPGDISTDLLGQDIIVTGRIEFIDKNDPEGVFFELFDNNCTIAAFIELKYWNSLSEEDKSIIEIGKRVIIEGNLKSFGDMLIVLVQSEPQLHREIVKESEAEKEEELEIVQAPDNYQLDVPAIYSGLEKIPGLCYLGSFAMMAKYHCPELEFYDVVACSGVGAKVEYIEPFGDSLPFLGNGIGEASIILATQNLNASFILCLHEEGCDSAPYYPPQLRFGEQAEEIIYFDSSDKSLNYLKEIIASGYPVVVYLDCYYVYDDFASCSDFWKNFMEKDHYDHYMTVTGYDKDYIYLNDPTDPTEAAINILAKTEKFKLAWEKGNEIGQKLGPYWMIYLSDMGTMKSLSEVISCNVELAKEAPSEIRKFATEPNSSDTTCFLLREIAKARIEFANFLEKNDMEQAASLYRESGNIFATISENGNVTASELNMIADKEEQALGLLGE